MKALVIGCGRVGSNLALQLDREGWDVTAVDEKEEALGRLGVHSPYVLAVNANDRRKNLALPNVGSTIPAHS